MPKHLPQAQVPAHPPVAQPTDTMEGGGTKEEDVVAWALRLHDTEDNLLTVSPRSLRASCGNQWRAATMGEA